ncbi:MAG: hypothetical protein HYX27_26685 [Acidobacteria bacterium]|nr:hypothetical protein [Acidobacteriota bacterium]
MYRSALITAAVYFVMASGIAIQESRIPRGSGGMLNRLFTFFATFPVSVPLAMCHIEPDLFDRWNVALLLFASTAVIYAVVAIVIGLVTGR